MRYLRLLAAFPRSLWFCLRYLPLRQAWRIPVWLAPNVRIRRWQRGVMQLGDPRTGMVRIGFHRIIALDTFSAHTILSSDPGARWILKADAHIGQGAIIHIGACGVLTVGRNFAISGNTSLICDDRITIGDDVQFSWNTLVMDGDAHKVYAENGERLNPKAPISIGNKVWVAANCTILKGASIGSNCVVAGGSLVNRPVEADNAVLAGTPVRPVRSISRWEV